MLATVEGRRARHPASLVDIILSNNGYEVVNIGCSQSPPSSKSPRTAGRRRGRVGLANLSTVVMRKTRGMKNTSRQFPVLGGAALTRYVRKTT